MSAPTLTWSAALLSWILAVPLWYFTKYVMTVAHEGGHALLFTLFFQRVRSITIDRDSRGGTVVGSKIPLPFDIVSTLAGYLGPSIFGLLGAWMLLSGHVVAVLWASLAFLVIMLFAVRTFFGFLLVPSLIAIIYLILTRVDGPLQTLYTHMWVWLLLIGAVQDMIVVVLDQIYDDEGSDPLILEQLTKIPSAVWAFLLLVGTIAALVQGGALLLRQG